MGRAHGPRRAGRRLDVVYHRLRRGRVVPRPGVAEPQLRQYVEFGLVRALVDRPDRDVDLVRPVLRVEDADVPVPALGEHTGVEQVERRIEARQPRVLVDEPPVRILGLRVLV